MFTKLWSWLNEPEIVNKIRGVGDTLRWAVAATALAAVLVIDPQFLWPLVLSIGVTQLIVEGMKRVMNFTPWGDRPDGNDNGFPSGHVAGTFSGAWGFYFIFGLEIAAIPLLLGAFTALSRVLPKKHSWAQVSVSAIVSYGFAQHFLA